MCMASNYWPLFLYAMNCSFEEVFFGCLLRKKSTIRLMRLPPATP